jgi:hypothetical protein
VTKPSFTPSLQWVANASGAMTGEAQRILRKLIDITFNRTGLETSKVVTGTAGTSGNLAAWNADGDLVDAGAAIAATTYSPTWVATGTQPAIGNGTLTGQYAKAGRQCSVRITLTPGSTTTFGTGVWSFTVPFSAASTDALYGFMTFSEDVGTAYFNGYTASGAVTTFVIRSLNSANGYGPTIPFTWVDGDRLIVNFTYITAA